MEQVVREEREKRGKENTRLHPRPPHMPYLQVEVILGRHILVFIYSPRPRKILHPKFLSLIQVQRPRLCHLEDGQHLGRDRSPRWRIVPETRDGACMVMVFNEDPGGFDDV